jgi:stalled ribosome alternative rescue factor ArfA
MVIKHTEGSNYAITRKLCHETACMSLERRERANKGKATLNQKAFHGHKQGYYSATDERFQSLY